MQKLRADRTYLADMKLTKPGMAGRAVAISAALLSIAALNSSAAEKNDCAIPDGLYVQRQVLEAQFFKAWGNGENLSPRDKAITDDSRMKERVIDQQYLQFMLTLAKLQ